MIAGMPSLEEEQLPLLLSQSFALLVIVGVLVPSGEAGDPLPCSVVLQAVRADHARAQQVSMIGQAISSASSDAVLATISTLAHPDSRSNKTVSKECGRLWRVWCTS